MSAIGAVAVEFSDHRLRGWRVFRADEPVAGNRGGFVVESDFTGVDLPLRLEVLERNKGNALVVIGSDLERIGTWWRRLGSAAPGVRLEPIVSGCDGDTRWVAFGFAKGLAWCGDANRGRIGRAET